jgi:hypothetical protein
MAGESIMLSPLLLNEVLLLFREPWLRFSRGEAGLTNLTFVAEEFLSFYIPFK